MLKKFLIPRVRVLKDKNNHLFSITILGLTVDGNFFPSGNKYFEFRGRFLYVMHDKNAPIPKSLVTNGKTITKRWGRFRIGTTRRSIRAAYLIDKATGMLKGDSYAVRKGSGLSERGLLLPADGSRVQRGL